MRKHLTLIILILVFLTGLSLLLYPTVSDWWNSFRQSKTVAAYSEEVADLDEETYQKLWAEAAAYNERLGASVQYFTLTEEEKKAYEGLLNVGGNGVMGYVEIPSIQCTLPIYHGTDDSILQVAVGHLEWSSLPVGGASSHCVLSGHRGLPSAKLFSNLDKLAEGDIFMLRTLDETLTYEVDQILIVEPEDTDALEIEEGKDLCTLVTCTPYGVNSHRLLVRGHRIENIEESGAIRVTADALQVDPILAASIAAIPMLLLLLAWVLLHNRRMKNKR